MRQPIGESATIGEFLRSDLQNFGFNPRTVDTLESLPKSRDTIVTAVNDLTADTNEIEVQPLLTFAPPTDPLDPILTDTRQLQGSDAVTFDVGASDAVLDLSDTGVTADTYGEPTKLIVLAIDAKGRITAASEVELNSDNVTEGTTNLFFTEARARASVSGSNGVSYNSGTGVFTLDQAFTRGLLSGGSGINYNSGTGVIATTGFSGTGAYTNFTFANGICTAAS